MINGMFEGAVDRLAQGLTYAARRHEVLSQNVANLETPGYRARDLVFDDQLRPLVDAIAGGGGETLAPQGDAGDRPLRLVQSGDGPAEDNGNDVRLDRQMARLAENTLFQHALVQILGRQFDLLKQAISGRS